MELLNKNVWREESNIDTNLKISSKITLPIQGALNVRPTAAGTSCSVLLCHRNSSLSLLWYFLGIILVLAISTTVADQPLHRISFQSYQCYESPEIHGYLYGVNDLAPTADGKGAKVCLTCASDGELRIQFISSTAGMGPVSADFFLMVGYNCR